MAEEQKRIASLAPDTFVEGAGLIDDIDAEITSARFVMWDYNKTQPVKRPALCLKLKQEDGAEAEQYYACGSEKEIAPTADGKSLVLIGKSEGLSQSSNAGFFLTALIDTGQFPADKLNSGDVSNLDGTVAHFSRVPAPERKGLKKQPRADGKEFEATILVITAVITLPGEKKETTKQTAKRKAVESKGAGAKGAAGTGTAATAGAGAAPAAADTDLENELEGIIIGILAGMTPNDAGQQAISKRQLPGEVFKGVKDNPNRNKLLQLSSADAYLTSRNAFYLDNNNVILGAAPGN